MRITSVLVLGAAANLDNLCVGLSYGVAGRKIKLIYNLIISLISGACCLLACGAASVISPGSIKYSVYIGSALLIIIGLYTIFAALKKDSDNREEEKRSERKLGLREALILGVALAINNFAVSFAAGMADAPPLYLSFFMVLFSILLVGLGNRLGKKLSNSNYGRLLNILSGLMLLAIGVWNW